MSHCETNKATGEPLSALNAALTTAAGATQVRRSVMVIVKTY